MSVNPPLLSTSTGSVWQPYREPLGITLARTGALAAILGGVLTAFGGGGLRHWPIAFVLMLWPALGGHWVELFFLNGLRPRLPAARWVQSAARLVTWFAGGACLAVGMDLTALALNHAHPRQVAWWIGGVAFIGIELIVHFLLYLRRRHNFYNGRG
jgi:hypothetical protein